MIKFQRVFN